MSQTGASSYRCSAATGPPAAQAQQTEKIARIGLLWHAGSAEEEGRSARDQRISLKA
jgi:hypothetical protein